MWSLISIGIVGLILVYNSYRLIDDPRTSLRYFGSFITFVKATVLITFGTMAIIQAWTISPTIELYCDGGFPQFGFYVENYVKQFVDIELYYIKNNMC